MVCWDFYDDEPLVQEVVAYTPIRKGYPVIGLDSVWIHCAEIPEEPKPRRATNLELMRWLAQGNGFFTSVLSPAAWTCAEFDKERLDVTCNEYFRVRKWDDSEWHEPTADYMGL